MAEGKSRLEWSRTSSLFATLLNAICATSMNPKGFVKRGGGTWKPADFNPYAPQPTAIPVPIEALKGMIPKKDKIHVK
jgi:hypothetical protein